MNQSDPSGEAEPGRRFASEPSRRALELDPVCTVLGTFAASDLGGRRIATLSPLADLVSVEAERRLVSEVGEVVEEHGALVTSQEEGWAEPLERLGSTRGLSTLHILSLARLLEDFERARSRIGDATPALLAVLGDALGGHAEGAAEDDAAAGIAAARALAVKARSVLDAHGEIRSDATPRLAQLTSGVRRTRESLYSAFERYARDNAEVLADDTVSRAEGRLAVLLPAGHRGRLQGIVHGRSGSEKSYYFEPLELVEENNRLQEQIAEEAEERERILSELGRAFGDAAPLIRAVGDLVGRLDLWQAAHRFSREVEGCFPVLEEDGCWSVSGARHPLLDPRLRALRERALGSTGHRGELVPLGLDAGEDRVLVITGPNAGGKTVALKTLGVLSFLAACGWPVPVAPESRMPFFRRWIAVVGDEQDVLAERSTFSAHLERLLEVWHEADTSTLVLLDEIAAGTNPEEGASLAIALLERLVERRSYAVLTTHLLQLANAALGLDGCASLAMEFDSETGSPAYSIRGGTPGSSHALDLARSLRLPAEWIARAEGLLGDEHMTLRHLIAETDRSRHRAVELEEELEALRGEQDEIRRRLEAEMEAVQEERKEARAKAKRELESFRRSARDELAREVKRTRRAERDRGGASERTASKEAARRASDLVARSGLAESLEEVDAATTPAADGRPPAEGDDVRHRSLGWTGTLDKLRDGRAEVLARGKRFRCSLDELERVSPSGSAARKGAHRKEKRRSAVTVSGGDPDVSMELMLVGERVEPALGRLDAYLDQALLAGLERVRVIHGHGTGALRNAVREHLRSDPRVAKVESAPAEQGGEGATLATMTS